MVRSHDDVTVPLWREPAFRNTLWLAGAAALAAALAGPGAAGVAGRAAPLGGLVLPALLGAAYVGMIEMGVAFVMWLSALKLSENTARVGNLIFLSPFVSLFFIRAFVGEEIHTATVVGLALVVAGIAFQGVGRRDPRVLR